MLIPMMRARHLSRGAWFKWSVIPVDDGVIEQVVSDVDGVLTLATAGGEIAEEFERFCRENLCMESWDFIVDVVRYQVRVCGRYIQHVVRVTTHHWGLMVA